MHLDLQAAIATVVVGAAEEAAGCCGCCGGTGHGLGVCDEPVVGSYWSVPSSLTITGIPGRVSEGVLLDRWLFGVA